MALWADLPEELLEEILKQVINPSDVVQFGLVCRSWSAVAIDGYTCFPHQIPLSICFPQPELNPMLMFPSKDGLRYCNFWNAAKRKLTEHVNLPETHGKWPCASSIGWVVMVDFSAPEEVVLFNPVTRAQIQLPPLSSFPLHQYHFPEDSDSPRHFCFINKAILSADPVKNQDNWILVVVVAFIHRLCIYRPGDDKWILVGTDTDRKIDDVVYFQGRFYTVNKSGFLSTFVVGSTSDAPEKLELFAKRPVGLPCDGQKYLVPSSQGELLLVYRAVEFYDKPNNNPKKYYTDMVVVYKLLNATKNEWEELKTLGDDVLFLGAGSSLCFSRHTLPKLKANSIYFTDDNWSYVDDDHVQCLDSGIYNYNDESWEPFESVDPSFLMRSLWIVPSIL